MSDNAERVLKALRFARFVFTYVRGDRERTPEYFAELQRLFEEEEQAADRRREITVCPTCGNMWDGTTPCPETKP